MDTLATVKKEQNILTVQNAFAEFLNGNIAGILEACTDDIEWGTHENPAVPFAKLYHGKNGAAEFFSTLGGSVDYISFKPSSYFADRDMVFVKGYHEATVKSTGKSFGHEFLMEFTLLDGKISSFFAWVDTLDQSIAFSK
jgi:ketosteroid isomerase-like protein